MNNACSAANYSAWIKAYVLRQNDALLGKCRPACEEMLLTFPELKIVRGHVYDAYWGKRGHFWLVTEDAKIIDPTRGQFPARSIQYEAWNPDVPVRVGKCQECGTEIFKCVETLNEKPKVESVCSAECEQKLRNYYDNIDYITGDK
jgi:hypothetical protein